ncbi:glycoside hydrolase family 28 [Paraburkholderia kururiensis]|uniref:glycoside hydrolase family 28 n=1 Tax=Paraburkholderia kururiensis TaxID=984307 RepID=UPI000347BBA0
MTHPDRHAAGGRHDSVCRQADTPVAAGPATASTPRPVYAFNVNAITLANVLIAGTTWNTSIVDTR